MVNDKVRFKGWLWFNLSDCHATFSTLFTTQGRDNHVCVCSWYCSSELPDQPSRGSHGTQISLLLRLLTEMHLKRAAEVKIQTIVKSEQAQQLQNATVAGEWGWESEKPQKSLAYHRLYHLINILHLSSPDALLRSGQAAWILHIKINALWKEAGKVSRHQMHSNACLGSTF